LNSSSSGGLNSSSASNNINSSGSNNSGASSNASSSVIAATSVVTVKGSKKSRLDTLDEVISSVIEHSVQKEDHGSSASVEGKPPVELKHFVRRYNWAQKGREPLPIRIMTLTESKILYPDVPHSWLCDGKLLRLNDPNCEGNYRIFQV
jgi:lysine-specific demethylase 3